MNRYPLWKNLLIMLCLVVAAIYALPNLYGEIPAVQISSLRANKPADIALAARVKDALDKAGIINTGVSFELGSVRAKFNDTDTQIKGKDIIERELGVTANNGDYVVALNLLSASPQWLHKLNALPMYLGLDLRGGVHFLMDVDMAGALSSRLDSISADIRSVLRDDRLRHDGISKQGNAIVIKFADQQTADAAEQAIRKTTQDLTYQQISESNGGHQLSLRLSETAARELRNFAVKQNISTLAKRVNELGVAEPVIQQQGANRIVVQLPGVQDVAKAKDILGRTATLEIRMVDDTNRQAALSGQVPFDRQLFPARDGGPDELVLKDVVLTGERLTDAQPGFDDHGAAAVNLRLDAAGSRIFKDITRENIGKRMAIILFEQGRGEVVTAPVIRNEIGGGRVQISGAMSTAEATDVSLLLRSGSLAAPMKIVEERTVGPSLGKENIAKGMHSTLWGFLAIAVFMIIYYLMFGVISVLALASNLLLLVAILSMLQATLTLPGIAAIALTLGMAIDANVLINERIREELRDGMPPHQAIKIGYERAWGTILDSNVTTLIAGLALLLFGSGPVRGFAVVHCIGILTSMFSAVLVSRMLTNLIYGHRKNLDKVAIG